jgi:hypothetical protein
MPVIPCGDAACIVCRPGGGAGGVVPVPPAAEISGGSGYTRGPFYPYGAIYPGYSTWFAVAREAPAVTVSQARQREVARQQEEYAKALAEQARLRAEAQEKTEGLLLRWLSPGQASTYREHQYFDVTGSDGRRYRILCQGQTGNVHLLDDCGRWTLAYCAHPRGLPDPVAWLTQAMAVVHDAEGFMRVANVYSANSWADPVPAEAVVTINDPVPADRPGVITVLRRGIGIR